MNKLRRKKSQHFSTIFTQAKQRRHLCNFFCSIFQKIWVSYLHALNLLFLLHELAHSMKFTEKIPEPHENKFYIFEKFKLSAFAGKKINAITILENFLSPREFTYCKNFIFRALELHFQVQKSKCPSTFLKISVRALHFWI